MKRAVLLLTGLATLAGAALWTWHAASADLARLRTLSQLRQDTGALGTGISDLMLERGDVSLLRALHANAQQLAVRLARVQHPATHDGVRRLHDIVVILRSLDQPRDTRSAAVAAPSLHAALRARGPELRAHEAAVHKAMDALMQSRHEAVLHTLRRGLGLLLGASLLAVLLGVLWARRSDLRTRVRYSSRG